MAAAIAEVTGARTLDALHLAAAQRVGGAAVPFLTFDLRQAQPARGLGLTGGRRLSGRNPAALHGQTYQTRLM
jgi:hypothetical protein